MDNHSREYVSWYNMKARCLNKKREAYERYGGRGITICDRWMDFDNFKEDMGNRPVDKTLDRIDNDKGYCKENCRWSTPKEQTHNRRNNVFIRYNGNIIKLCEEDSINGVPIKKIRHRKIAGWSDEESIGIKKRRPEPRDMVIPDISKIGIIRFLREKNCSFKSIGEYLGVSKQRIHQLIK